MQGTLDRWISRAGVVTSHVGVVLQLAGFIFALVLGDPILGDRMLNAGFWVAGLGGAGIVYGIKVGAGGPVPYPGGPRSYTPPERRGSSALFAVAATPLWAVLSLPVAIMACGLLVLALFIIAGQRAFRARLAPECARTSPVLSEIQPDTKPGPVMSEPARSSGVWDRELDGAP